MWELGTIWIYLRRMGFRLSLQHDYLNLRDNYYSSGSWRESGEETGLKQCVTKIYLDGAWLFEGIGF
jgi:hypothetical protein